MPRVPITSLSNHSHSTPLPFSPSPPPHRLAGACHRGPVGSQGPMGSKQTVFSKNCRRVVGCSQAHPPGTCSHDITTFMYLPTWTQVNISMHPGKHPPAHVYVHTRTHAHTHRPSVSTHTQRHMCTTQTFNAIDPHTLLAHTFNTHTRTDQRYVPNMQTAKGVYIATFKCIQLWLCTRIHAHIHHSTFNSLQWDSKWAWGHTLPQLHHSPPALHIKEKERGTP